MLTVKPLAIPDIKLLTPKQFPDARGFVVETMSERQLQQVGISTHFVQENQSFSRLKNTVRGIHSQKPPHAQAKLVRCLTGKIVDVAVDVRPGSPTFGKHVSAILSADEVVLMYIPVGFLHGFCTLEDNTTVLYKMSKLYEPSSETGVMWDDPDLNIQWPVDKSKVVISDKDKKLGSFKDYPSFAWS